MDTNFNQLPLKNELQLTLAEIKFSEMTGIQQKALPSALQTKNIIAQAKTGSGKTAVFGLSILNGIDLSQSTPQSLILCPTRELAEQVAKEIRMLGRKFANLKVLTLCGGMAQRHQERSLEHGAHILVGTPGRILSLLKSQYIEMTQMSSFVLDEADKMLQMGFQEDILKIYAYCSKKEQILFFSATFAQDIKDFALKIATDAEMIYGDTDHDQGTIEQIFYALDSHKDKNKALLKLIKHYRLNRFLIFCKTKKLTDDVADFLLGQKIACESIHGDLEQRDRTAVLTMFANQSLCGLVATDVAARGLDIDHIPVVINYDLPGDNENYIHRIGRTARAGSTGQAFSFYVEQQVEKLELIDELLGFKPARKSIEELTQHPDFIPTPTMVTLYLRGGKKDKLRPGDIVGAFVKVGELQASEIGNIDILNVVSYVAVTRDKAESAITKLNAGKIKNRKFKVGFA